MWKFKGSRITKTVLKKKKRTKLENSDFNWHFTGYCKGSVTLAINRHMDHEVEPRVKKYILYLWPIDFWQRCQDNSMGKIVFSTNGTRWLDIYMQNNECGLILHTIHKNELTVDHRLQCNS